MKYDYLIVGAGLFGATLAQQLTEKGKKVLVVERKNHIGGMCYTEYMYGIIVHKYGAHIFRTDDKSIWKYVNKFTSFKPFINSPLAKVNGEFYNLPFNMNTFYQLWALKTPDEAREKIESEIISCDKRIDLQNAEEYALSKVGKTIYEMFIKEYTEKQWGKKCTELPASILGRLPLRFTYDNNYYANKPYQGVPKDGYTGMIQYMLAKADVILGIDDWRRYENQAERIIYTGSIDEYFDYKFGILDYRSLKFEECIYTTDNYQGNAVINHCDKEDKYTRVIEHKHFLGENSIKSVVSYEMPVVFNDFKADERYYPIEDERNKTLYRKYLSLHDDTIFAGRLGSYKYTDMEQTIKAAMRLGASL